ncbi:MAG: site-specific integrase [Bacteroidia bacterium]|nr:site-specific integrase [Bacteroidia bacterium]
MDIKNSKIDLINPNSIGVVFEAGKHKGQSVIWIRFEKDMKLVAQLKNMLPMRWSQSHKYWYMLNNKSNRNRIGWESNVVGDEVLNKIGEVNKAEFTKFQNLLELKSYSPNTKRTYSTEFAQFLGVLKNVSVSQITPERLQSYFLYCVQDLKLSENTIHSRINAIKFYFEQVLHKDKMFFDIPRPKKPFQLPKALSMNEVRKIIEITQNSKHKLILKLCYGMGLRVSELVNLKMEHIDSQNKIVLIKNAKGKKDRMVKLPDSVLEEMRQYYLEYRPEDYLFEGKNGGQFSVRSVQLVFKNAMKKAGIKKTIGIHGLRHSYATHLLEMGTDLSLIQKLLGHKDIKTTLINTQVTDKSITKIKSPLDNL